MNSVDVNIIVQNLTDCLGGNLNKKGSSSPSIYMAPPALRNLSPASFKPRVVSIGPLHKKDENLQRFEVQKAIFVQRLLARSAEKTQQTPKHILTACAEKVVASVNKIRGCYADITDYDDNQLAEMMVLDAGFILQFTFQIYDSPGSKLMWLENYIPYDLILLENQIPFFVLNDIFECTILKFEKNLYLTQFIHPLLKYPNLFQGKIKLGNSGMKRANYDHILGYLHQCYKPKLEIESYFPGSTIHSAVELDRAGIKFKPNQDHTKWALSMEVESHRCSCIFWFFRKPALRMPTLRINHFTELVLRNLIAYEQLFADSPYVTSYATAMDMLIDTHDDVAKLVRSKVIINHIGSNEEAASMINSICKDVVWETFFYGQQWEQLDSYFNGYWPRKIVKLRRTYFSSPWSIIALIAGMVLFALAVVQTLFTVKSAGN